ncbi:Oidioi.mRNA.OKI2018_I69.XSR.g13307.t1.cds [Oikopleura dioica]|uniref:Oidioi.mRNA.OKI2018_I69.XSR.g13307.t1.cds n=1 Tax=Oikopleura dioica TaxID=34765 RepID=A0ABN7S6Z1_OIKDI|nr:Oidioi.mRNA.OKI2018_I69.XSR.g13307.t1.cds [Oikopleura dioica]
MKFSDLFRFWRLKERGHADINVNQFLATRSEYDISSSCQSSIWSRKPRKSKIKKTKPERQKNEVIDYDSGNYSSGQGQLPKMSRFREQQRFWETKTLQKTPRQKK